MRQLWNEERNNCNTNCKPPTSINQRLCGDRLFPPPEDGFRRKVGIDHELPYPLVMRCNFLSDSALFGQIRCCGGRDGDGRQEQADCDPHGERDLNNPFAVKNEKGSTKGRGNYREDLDEVHSQAVPPTRERISRRPVRSSTLLRGVPIWSQRERQLDCRGLAQGV